MIKPSDMARLSQRIQQLARSAPQSEPNPNPGGISFDSAVAIGENMGSLAQVLYQFYDSIDWRDLIRARQDRGCHWHRTRFQGGMGYQITNPDKDNDYPYLSVFFTARPVTRRARTISPGATWYWSHYDYYHLENFYLKDCLTNVHEQLGSAMLVQFVEDLINLRQDLTDDLNRGLHMPQPQEPLKPVELYRPEDGARLDELFTFLSLVGG